MLWSLEGLEAVRDPAAQETFRKNLNSEVFKISLEDPTGAWG